MVRDAVVELSVPASVAEPVQNNGNEASPDDENEVRVCGLLEDLLRMRSATPPVDGKPANIEERHLELLCARVRGLFLQQPMLLDLDAPMKVAGDIHGQFFDLLRLLEYGGEPRDTNYLFLGDYVDRGKNSIECISLLFTYKVLYPENFFILRGNHESSSINKLYGFFDECKRRYSVKIWKTFGDAFNSMPVCALIDDRILCMHGGLSPHLHHLDDARTIPRPSDVPDAGLLCDLLWADPSNDVQMWGENDRGVSFVFGSRVLEAFLRKHDLDLIVRAHQVVQDGYEFFGERSLVTVFSAPNYCCEFDNAGAMIDIDRRLMCSFKVLKPIAGDVTGGSAESLLASDPVPEAPDVEAESPEEL